MTVRSLTEFLLKRACSLAERGNEEQKKCSLRRAHRSCFMLLTSMERRFFLPAGSPSLHGALVEPLWLIAWCASCANPTVLFALFRRTAKSNRLPSPGCSVYEILALSSMPVQMAISSSLPYEDSLDLRFLEGAFVLLKQKWEKKGNMTGSDQCPHFHLFETAGPVEDPQGSKTFKT